MKTKSRARVICLPRTDRQTVNYYSTIRALDLIYFDSNTHKNPSDSTNFPPLH